MASGGHDEHTTPSSEPKERLIHLIVRDPELVLYLDNHPRTKLYAVAHDRATESHEAHYHLIISREQTMPMGKLVRDCRRVLGCKGPSAEAKTCRERESGKLCSECEFFLHYKHINSWPHARNCFEYIQNKENAVTHPESDLTDVEYPDGFEVSEEANWEILDGSSSSGSDY